MVLGRSGGQRNTDTWAITNKRGEQVTQALDIRPLCVYACGFLKLLLLLLLNIYKRTKNQMGFFF